MARAGWTRKDQGLATVTARPIPMAPTSTLTIWRLRAGFPGYHGSQIIIPAAVVWARTMDMGVYRPWRYCKAPGLYFISFWWAGSGVVYGVPFLCAVGRSGRSLSFYHRYGLLSLGLDVGYTDMDSELLFCLFVSLSCCVSVVLCLASAPLSCL